MATPQAARTAELLEQRPFPAPEICEQLCQMARIADLSDIPLLLDLAARGGLFDEHLAHPALVLLPSWGADGIRHLKEHVPSGHHSRAALMILLCLATGTPPTHADLLWLPETWADMWKWEPPPDISGHAAVAVRELMLDQVDDVGLRAVIFWAFSTQLMTRPPVEGVDHKLEFFLSCFMDTRLVLNEKILSEFSDLLDSAPDREEELQKFLFQHPILLDPLTTEIRNEHELGDDFITDYVVRRINNEYLLVEIENTTDALFNQNGQFSAALTEAVGQVRDFQAWVSENIAYARAKLPDIRHPDGIVVIGRRGDLTPDMERRLEEENFSRHGHIKILTYDDLLGQARTIYSNMLTRPTSFKGKKPV